MMPSLLVLALLAAEPTPPPPHELSLYARSGLTFFISNSRTHGGLGGGFGVRDTLSGLWLLQADAQVLGGLGNVLELRAGVGVQRPGTWTPAVLLNTTCLLGDRLSFPTVEAPLAGSGPTLAFSLTVAPLRFRHERMQVALLQLSAGVGPDTSGSGILVGLNLLEVASSF